MNLVSKLSNLDENRKEHGVCFQSDLNIDGKTEPIVQNSQPQVMISSDSLILQTYKLIFLMVSYSNIKIGEVVSVGVWLCASTLGITSLSFFSL